MDFRQPKIIDANEPLSKALDEILSGGTAVFVTKGGQLYGLIDDRNIRLSISDASRTKCESACVKCPSLAQGSGIPQMLEAFLAGHFKSLPVLDAQGRITGALTRADLLRELVSQKLVPRAQLYQHMSRPAYAIDHSQTMAHAKSLMRKTGAHYLVVTYSGNVAGTISTLDFTGFLTKPRERPGYQIISEVKSLDSKRVEDVMRPGALSLEETATLEEAAESMARESVSHVVVTQQKKPVGMLAATDIFKMVRRLYETESDVLVSGLDADSLAYYGKIKEEILGAAGKFGKSLKIENLAVHIKKGKSVYEANMHLDLNNRHIAFRCEGYSLGDTVAALSKELKIMLEKAKSEKMERKKPPRSPEE